MAVGAAGAGAVCARISGPARSRETKRAAERIGRIISSRFCGFGCGCGCGADEPPRPRLPAAEWPVTARRHHTDARGHKAPVFEGPARHHLIAHLDIRKGDVLLAIGAALAEFRILIHRDGLRCLVRPLHRQRQTLFRRHFAGSPGLAEFRAHLLDPRGLLRIQHHDEHRANRLRLLVEMARSHHDIARMDVGELHRFAVLENSRVRPGFHLVDLALLVLDGDVGAGNRGHRSMGAVAAHQEHAAAASAPLALALLLSAVLCQHSAVRSPSKRQGKSPGLPRKKNSVASFLPSGQMVQLARVVLLQEICPSQTRPRPGKTRISGSRQPAGLPSRKNEAAVRFTAS